MKILIRALKPFRLLLPALLGATFCCAAGALVRIWYAQSVSDFMRCSSFASAGVTGLYIYCNAGLFFCKGKLAGLFLPEGARYN